MLGFDSIGQSSISEDVSDANILSIEDLVIAVSLQNLDLIEGIDFDPISVAVSLQTIDLIEDIDFDPISVAVSLQNIDLIEDIDFDVVSVAVSLQTIDLIEDIDFDAQQVSITTLSVILTDETTSNSIEQHKSVHNAIVELYEIDATNIGGSIYYLSPTVSSSETAIVWNSQTYTPFPIASDGWTRSSDGALPRPKLQISTVDKLIQAAVISLDDLVGARVIRRRIFEQFLDGGAFPNPSATFPIDDYIINQKVSQTKIMLTFELISFLDREGSKIPARQMLRTDFPGLAQTRIRR